MPPQAALMLTRCRPLHRTRSAVCSGATGAHRAAACFELRSSPLTKARFIRRQRIMWHCNSGRLIIASCLPQPWRISRSCLDGSTHEKLSEAPPKLSPPAIIQYQLNAWCMQIRRVVGIACNGDTCHVDACHVDDVMSRRRSRAGRTYSVRLSTKALAVSHRPTTAVVAGCCSYVELGAGRLLVRCSSLSPGTPYAAH